MNRLASALGMLLGVLALLSCVCVTSCVGVALTRATSASAAVAAPGWSWPLDERPTIVRGFEPPPQPWFSGHRGVDLLASPGELVLAAGAGRVTFAGWVGGVPAVAVSHPDGRRTTYEPVLAAVTRGDEVSRGAILGRLSAGGSHCLPRACLHWGLRRGSVYLDPLALLGDPGIDVRLLPLWSGGGTPPRSGAAGQLLDLPATADLARLGALNRARASPWEAW
jgi:Peptidase family M23